MEPVAICGMAMRLPGAHGQCAATPEDVWSALMSGSDLRTVRKLDSGHELRGYFLPEATVREWDHQAFQANPRQAAQTDPQQRLLLETSREALERAGLGPGTPDTGVFVGASLTDYRDLATARGPDGITSHFSTGTALAMLAGRISHQFDFDGPSMVVDNACASGLTAVHLACQSLRTGESRTAVVGAANLILSPWKSMGHAKAGLLSPDARCKTFDAAADGYARGEGVVVLVLRRLADAQADGQPVLAVVRGTAANHVASGPRNVAEPSAPAQAACIQRALRSANLQPRDVGYLELHGTGTQAGDEGEARALHQVFGGSRPGGAPPLLLGGVKSNIGHLEAASGLASMIKAVLALRYGQVPPNINCPTLRAEVATHLVAIPARLVRHQPAALPARACVGISAFGFSGSNAHVLLSGPPERAVPAPGVPRMPAVALVLCGSSPAAVHQQSQALALGLKQGHICSVHDAAAALAARHQRWPWRRHQHHAVAVAADATAMISELEQPLAVSQGQDQPAPLVAFVFTGQGAQRVGMALQLYGCAPVFRRAFDEAAELFADSVDVPAAMWGAIASDESLADTATAMAALFVVQYALLQLWRSLGVCPDMVLGHSAGEVAALCAAGVWTLPAAAQAVKTRARWLTQIPAGQGAMVAVRASANAVAAVLAALPADLQAQVRNKNKWR